MFLIKIRTDHTKKERLSRSFFASMLKGMCHFEARSDVAIPKEIPTGLSALGMTTDFFVGDGFPVPCHSDRGAAERRNLRTQVLR